MCVLRVASMSYCDYLIIKRMYFSSVCGQYCFLGQCLLPIGGLEAGRRFCKITMQQKPVGGMAERGWNDGARG